MVACSTASANLDHCALPDAGVRVETVEAIVGFAFHDRSLLLQALLHRSAVIERQRDGGQEINLPSNERLEFLGDAIISMLVARYAYEHFPDYDEGRLTEVRAALVRRSTLGLLADSIDLGPHMYMGRSERKIGGRGRMTVLAEGLEALIAAIYLDHGLEAAECFMTRLLRNRVPELLDRAGSLNAKSRLQEYAQTNLKLIPSYKLMATTGPAHDARFTVEVNAGLNSGIGSGTSKQNAEQDAALTLLKRLQHDQRVGGQPTVGEVESDRDRPIPHDE
jgi:ribonuclease-3